jgi:hypothetical protein
MKVGCFHFKWFIFWIHLESMVSSHSPHNSCHHICRYNMMSSQITSSLLSPTTNMKRQNLHNYCQIPFQNFHLLYHYLYLPFTYHLKSFLSKKLKIQI